MKRKYSYFITIDGLGNIKLWKVKEEDVENFILNKQNVLFSEVRYPEIKNNELVIKAEDYEPED